MFPLLLAWSAACAAPPPVVAPLKNAHAHNDYAHPRPLHDALARGFGSVEADLHWLGGELRVGHTWLDARPGRTFESLYLEPLRRRVAAHGGRVHRGGEKFWLLIDLKTEAKATYEAVDRALAARGDLFSVWRDGRFEERAVTAVISGECPRELIAAQRVRYAAIDGRPRDLDSDAPAHLVPWVSSNWGSHFRWSGVGPIPEAERALLRDMVRRAHARGRLVRFWGTPDRESVWREQRAAGVDLINTDRLDALREFLLKP